MEDRCLILYLVKSVVFREAPSWEFFKNNGSLEKVVWVELSYVVFRVVSEFNSLDSNSTSKTNNFLFFLSHFILGEAVVVSFLRESDR